MATSTLQTDGSQTLAAPTQQVVNTNFQPNSIGPGNSPYLNVASAPAPSTTFDASSLSQTNPSIQFPTNSPSVQTGASTANGLNSSIPTPQSIISGETATTPAEATNTGLMSKLATLIGGQSSLATQQIQNENNAGVPNLTKITNDLSTQLMGLNDQATKLQLDAGAGGTIQNQEQQNAQGRGITTGGLAPMTSADLRNNQIQQSAIAAQSLTVKSAYYAANNNLTLAKDAADKAAQVAFDADTQKINYVKALIDANAPQMNKEEKGQTDLVQAQLQDRQNQIEQQKTDYMTGIGLINNAMKFNGQDPQAQLAIQAAQKIDPHDPMYLQKVGALLTPYQQDPVATQQALAQLALTKANTANTYANIANTQADTANKQNPNSKPPTATQTTYANYAPRLETADATINSLTPNLARMSTLGFAAQQALPSAVQTSNVQAYNQAKSNFISGVLRQESGAAISDSERAAYDKQYFPQPGDSQAVIDQKAQNRAQVISSYKTAAGPAYVAPIVATPSSTNVTKSGKPFDVAGAKAAGYSQADIDAYLNSH